MTRLAQSWWTWRDVGRCCGYQRKPRRGNTHRLLPITPEFAKHLATVKKSDRRGHVFNLTYGDKAKSVNRTRHAVGKYIADIGKAAGVVTKLRDRKGEVVKDFATAHDLRRAFGFRWSRRVMPTVLRELMRHESLETTMRYYVGVNAEATADELWAAIGGNLGGAPNEAKNEDSKTTVF